MRRASTTLFENANTVAGEAEGDEDVRAEERRGRSLIEALPDRLQALLSSTRSGRS